MGNLERLILLLKTAIAQFARILRSSRVGVKEQFFAEIVKPRYSKVFTFSIRTLLI